MTMSPNACATSIICTADKQKQAVGIANGLFVPCCSTEILSKFADDPYDYQNPYQHNGKCIMPFPWCSIVPHTFCLFAFLLQNLFGQKFYG